MTTVDDRLKDLRRATGEQVVASVDLLGRITGSVERRRPTRWTFGVAFAAALAAVVAVALLGRAPEQRQQVISRPPTNQEFLAAANQRCREYQTQTAPAIVLFPSAPAYALAAENRVAAITRSISQAESLGAPPEAQQLLADAIANLRAGLRLAQEAKERAAASDVEGAGRAFDGAEAAVSRAGNAFADHGAEDCRS
jgi:hypothetical protein